MFVLWEFLVKGKGSLKIRRNSRKTKKKKMMGGMIVFAVGIGVGSSIIYSRIYIFIVLFLRRKI